MSREHQSCGACSKFVAGHCTGFDRPAKEDDRPCVLFVLQGSREARLGAKSEQELLAEIQRHNQEKTWKRQSYKT